MNQQAKERIKRKIIELSGDTSQAKVAAKIGISKTAVSFIVNDKWAKIKDRTWRTIKINLNISDEEWVIARTKGLVELVNFLKVVKSEGMSVAIAADAGIGKTEAFRYLTETKMHVYHIKCASHWTMRIFLQKVFQTLGLEYKGLTQSFMADKIIEHLKAVYKPIIIFDEADKLRDNIFLYLIDMYNQLDGNTAFVYAGTPFLQNMVEQKASRDARGFREFYSRIGKTFISLGKITSHDVQMICIENEVEDGDEIDAIYNSCDGDIRRVKRSILRYKKMRAKSQSS